jgi:hypothetical protein
MILPNIIPFDGQHCETNTTGTLLRKLNIDLSEPMLFGLGEGLDFFCWNLDEMILPFISGRIRPSLLSSNLARNLKFELSVNESISSNGAWENLKQLIDNGHIVGLKLDCFYLDYFTKPYHFAEHFVAMYGYDEINAYLIDTAQQGGKVKTSLSSLALARTEKGPMNSCNLCYTISKTDCSVDLKSAILAAIKNNAKTYLFPTNQSEGIEGLAALSSMVLEWSTQIENASEGFKRAGKLMEKAGTGGALFRRLYRDFLSESYDLLQISELLVAQQIFAKIATDWTLVANLFVESADKKNLAYIQTASVVLKTIAINERNAMTILLNIK